MIYLDNAATTPICEVAKQTIRTTARHEFYIIDKGWIRAEELQVGDRLSSKEDIDTTITKIKVIQQKERIPVYNMVVDGHHNYLITEDNLLVHNGASTYVPILIIK